MNAIRNAALKILIVVMGVAGIILFAIVCPYVFSVISSTSPALKMAFWPWQIFVWIAAIPCYSVLVYIWKIASSLKSEKFSKQNSKQLKIISLLTIADVLFVVVMNIVFYFSGFFNFALFVTAVALVILGLSFAAIVNKLSVLFDKALDMQSEIELTI